MNKSKATSAKQLKAIELITAYCKNKGYSAPQLEYRFHETRRWRVDLAWPTILLALEIEGISYRGAGTRHQRGTGIEADMEKYNEATCLGWRVLRVTYKQIESGQVYTWLDSAFLLLSG